jgi:hypothetical protein
LPWATATARGEISIMSDQVRDFSPCSIVNSFTPVEPQRTETHHHTRPPVANRHGHPPWANFPSWRVEPVRVRKSSRCFLEGFDWHLSSVVAGELYGVYQSIPKYTQSVPNENSFVFYARVPQPWSFVCGLSAGPGMFLGFLRLAPRLALVLLLRTGAPIRLKLSRHGQLIMPFSADAFPRLVAFDRFGGSDECIVW